MKPTTFPIEYRSDDVTKKLFLHFSVLDTMSRWSMMRNIHSPNLVGIGSWGPKIWPHKYLLSPIEISVNWPGSKQLFTLISMGLIRYSCGHIFGHHEPIHVKFGVWRFFIMLYRNMVIKMLKCKHKFLMTSHFGTLFLREIQCQSRGRLALPPNLLRIRRALHPLTLYYI